MLNQLTVLFGRGIRPQTRGRIHRISCYLVSIFTECYFFVLRQQEIDYVEEDNGRISGYEFKWNPKKKARFPKRFQEKYQAKLTLINQENFREFVREKN